MEEKGTLDKFIGDAVMAIYNAPLDVSEHAAHACRSAVKMLQRLEQLNAGFAKRGMPRIDIGIGINTGEAVVGNMGADIRFDYTAIGDTVNLSARLEGLTKFYGTQILVSEATKSQAGEGFLFREVDLVRVKGKNEPVAVYQLLTAQLEHHREFAEALALYRSKEFPKAADLFAGIAGKSGDKVSELYLSRCREFTAAPPPGIWDGVYVAQSK